MTPVSLSAAFEQVHGPWSPLTIATVNDYDVRVFEARGKFTRHVHPDTDEFFLVLDGTLTIRLEDDAVTLGAGDVYVVPRGVAHQPMSDNGARALLFEPSTTVNTGDRPGELTSDRRVLG